MRPWTASTPCMTTHAPAPSDPARSDPAPTDEELIRAYARTRAPASLEALVARHWPFAYRVALRTLADPGAAEDAAQEALVGLARDASRFEEGRAFLPWFRTIVSNSVRTTMRARRRRTRHERTYAACRPDAAPAPALEAALAQEVQAQLATLDEDVRLPLVLHYYEGCSHAEVGEAVGCPTGTASSRIRRGLEQLRESLVHAGWSVTLLDLERWGEHAATGNAAVATPAPPSVAAIERLAAARTPAGASALALKLAPFVLALALVAAVALETARSLRESVAVGPPAVAPTASGASLAGPTSPPPAPEVATASLAPDSLAPSAPAAVPADRALAAVASTATSATRVAVLVTDRAGQPVAGATVRLALRRSFTGSEPEATPFDRIQAVVDPKVLATATTDANGAALLEASIPEGASLRALASHGSDAGASEPFAASSGGEPARVVLRPVDDVAPGRASLLVHLVGPEAAVAHVRISGLLRPSEATSLGDAVPFEATTDASGTIAFRELPPGSYRLSLDDPPRGELDRDGVVTPEVVLAAGELLRLERAVRLLDGRVRGRVVVASGTLPDRLSLEIGGRVAHAGDDGLFDERAAPDEELVVVADGYGTQRRKWGELAGTLDLGDVVLGAGATVTGRAVAGRGPRAGAYVTLVGDAGEAGVTRSGAGGEFRIAGVPPGTYEVQATEGGYVPREIAAALARRVVVGAEGEVAAGDVSLPPLLEGVVRGPDGSPVPGVVVTLRREPDGNVSFPRTDEAGRFTAEALPPGRWRVDARTDSAVLPVPVVVEVETLAGPLELRLVPGGSIAGRLLGPPERLARKYEVSARPLGEGAGEPVEAKVEQGTFRLGGLRAGRYRLTLAPGGASAEVEVPGGGEVPCELALPEGLGRLRVTVPGLTGERTVTVSRGDEELGRAEGEGPIELHDLAPGSVSVSVAAEGRRAMGDRRARIFLEGTAAVVVAGETAALEVAWPTSETGGTITGSLKGVRELASLFAQAEKASALVAVEGDGRFVLGPLPPGVYTLTIGRGDRRAEVEATVSAGKATDVGTLALPER